MKDIRLLPFAIVAFVTAARFAAGAADNPSAAATTEDVKKDNNGPCQAIRAFASDRLGTPLTPLNGKSLINLQSLDFPCVLPPQLPLNFVIASVPDPIGTHLQLWFDRSVESILSAAGYVGFRFQRSWIPWDADLVREEPDTEKREVQQDSLRLREGEPGVLLFRAHNCPSPEDYLTHLDCRDLVVLLVPETPTGGLAQDVFLAATKIVLSTWRPLGSDSRIPVLGPAFSGSFSSLAKIMDSSLAKIMDRGDDSKLAGKLLVISGTASSKAFEVLPENADYHGTVHSVDDQLLMLEDHIKLLPCADDVARPARFSAPRNQGNRASSRATASAAVGPSVAHRAMFGGGTGVRARRARRARWLRPWARPPRAPRARSCKGDLLKSV
jgi:hypothetical protein